MSDVAQQLAQRLSAQVADCLAAYDRLRLRVDAEASRITGRRLAQKLASGQPGPEGSVMKLVFARVAKQLSGLEVELLGEDGLR